MKKKFLLTILLLTSLTILSGQIILTKDSFFLAQKSLPNNYKSVITNTKWLYLGTWQSNMKKIYTPDTIKPVDLMIFEDMLVRRHKHFRHKVVYVKDTSELMETVTAYHKIKGNKIVSKNTDCGTQKIIYVDNSTLILESKDKKIIYRTLYRKQS